MHRYYAITPILFLVLFVGYSLAEEKALSLNYQKTSLENGLKVIMVEHHELPTVAVELLVRAGSAHDLPGREGLAHLVSSTLLEGTTRRTSQEISEEIDFTGGTLSADCNYDSTSITATSLKRDLPTILDLITDVARHPSFPSEELERQRDKATTAILRERDDKAAIARRHFHEMLYAGHPYDHPPLGTLEGVKAVTREEVLEFHNRHYLPGNSILVVVGDIEPGPTLEELRRSFGDWSGEMQSQPAPPALLPQAGQRIRLIDKPDLTQTEIRIGHLGIDRASPEYFPLLLLNRILGVGPTSRLYTRLRAERGLTYSVRSQFDARKQKGPFVISTYTKNETTLETLQLLLEELKRLKKEGITSEELQGAKAYFAGHFPLNIETPAQIASQLLEQEFYGLPEGYLENYIKNIKSVTLQEVNSAAARFLDPNNILIVLVSKAEEVLEKVKTLGEVELKGL
jgi:zinc protease